MGQKFYTLLTQQGAALLANATALGIPLKLSKMAIGDANGSATTPDATQTKLVHEVYQAPLNSLNTDEKNPNQIIAELVIPENQGGWFINEIGLFDENDNLVAVGNCPATYKPKLSEGSGRTQVIRMIIVVDNVNAVALKIDPSVVLATRKYVDDLITSKIVTHEKSTNHPNATTTSKGFVQLNSATDSTIENQAATPKAVRDTYEYARFSDIKAQSAYDHASAAHKRIDPIADKFHCDLYESRIYSQDKRFYQIVRDDGVVGLYSLVKNDFSWFINHDGWISGFIEAPRIGGLDEFVKDRVLPVGIPQPWPSDHLPTGWLECNGSPFDVNRFPKLAFVYPRGALPDLRGLFIRGKDNYRGLDPNRDILSYQDDAIRNIWGNVWPISETFGQNGGTGDGAFGYFEALADGTPTKVDWGNAGGISFDASRVVPVADENRPRNIAFMYIVKAE
ncbi:phage tail protein [uncultured Gilliamella sp.]|uniref:phage tail protein n=1 Tax=uncultured Gilliamella sp. TaxID=1193505 RepID=UPI0025D154DA|nr:phage tail protein [uncultured Gilliamella sp.]